MRFFRLTHPRYKNDIDYYEHNPVRCASQPQLPCMICPVCGLQGFGDRIRIPIDEDRAAQIAAGPHLDVEEWKKAAQGWAVMLGLPVTSLTPGADIGPPRGEPYPGPAETYPPGEPPISEDVLHPDGSVVWVTEPVRDLLERAKFNGLAFSEVVFVGFARPPQRYWELVPLGRAWRVGSTEEELVDCKVCGRTIFPRGKVLDVDPARWDGSDFFNVDFNPNLLMVTERVRDVMVTARVSNIAFVDAGGE